jgi:hypothetical protein
VYLGVHHGRWLEQLSVPMCVSLRTMEKYRDDWETHPKCFQPWILDSGAFTEITRYGEWRYDPDRFGGVVTRILDNVGTPPVFCAVQDMPCEPRSLAASGLTVPMHQELTTESVCYLRAEFRNVPWIPILQGWQVADYVNHVALYQKAGIDLTWEPVGSQIRLHFLIDHFISTSFMKRW